MDRYFCPLSGNYISQSSYPRTGCLRKNRFRPLSGNYISQFVQNMDNCDFKTVSVPCRGTIFLNWYKLFYKCRTTTFPSPVGELYFSISMEGSKRYVQRIVSVPCRGTIFLNTAYNGLNSTDKVSVPCRGTIFLNQNEDVTPFEVAIVSVPCRGTIFLNKE